MTENKSVVVAAVATQFKVLLPNTALECRIDDTFIDLFKCIQGKPSTHANVSNLSYDNIMRIKIKDIPKLLGRENDGIIVRQVVFYYFFLINLEIMPCQKDLET